MAFVHSFTYTPPKRYDATSWASLKIEESADDSTWADVETQALTADADPTTPAERSITTEVATLETGYFRFTAIDGDGDEGPTSSSVFSPSSTTSAFATADELADRLGTTLSDDTQAEAALAAASAVVAAELDKEVSDISPVPALIKHVTITVALRAFANPQGLTGEQIGAYRYSAKGAGLELSKVESLLIRRAYYGATSGSTRPESTSDEVWDYLYS